MISDETLCAFLDQELGPEEMEQVRSAIATQPQLAARLSALSQADKLARQHAHALDQKPIPESIMALLADDQPIPGEDSTSPAWLSRHHTTRLFPAFAVTLALVIGLTWLLLPQNNARLELSAYEQQLTQALSGNTVRLDEETSLISHFSFRDREGRYCRQYRLSSPSTSTENIACHDGRGWTEVASIEASSTRPGEYQAASQDPALEPLLDEMMQGEVLTLSEERAQIQADWAPSGQGGAE